MPQTISPPWTGSSSPTVQTIDRSTRNGDVNVHGVMSSDPPEQWLRKAASAQRANLVMARLTTPL